MKLTKTLLGIAEWTCAAMLPIIAAIRNQDATAITHPLLQALNAEVVQNYVWLITFFAVGVLATKLIQAILERWSTNHGAAKAVLDSAHKVYFQNVGAAAPGQEYLHRVTLYRARRHVRDWNVSTPFTLPERSLRMYCRSGTAYQKSGTRLAVNDNNEAANEGIAGRAWFTNANCTVSDLPEWPHPEPQNPEENDACRAYAERGRLPLQKASTLNVKSRSVSAHVVRTRTGDRWGVLVFDSREAQGVSDQGDKKAIAELSAYLLTQIL